MVAYRFSRRAEVVGKSAYDHAPGAILLSVGSAYPDILPDLSQEAADAATRYTAETMQYGPLMGLDELRDEIVAYVRQDGVTCDRDNVIVANGAKHATELAFRVFVEHGDRVIVTAPTYMTTLLSMRNQGANFVAIPQDKDGMRTDILERRLETMSRNAEPLPKLLFDVPDFHNPTSVTLSLQRRKHLIELAEQYNFIIIEDDPYRRIRFEGDPVPPLKSLDTHGVVIAVGTVSKILAPGLRIGWAIADQAVIRRMALHKSDGGSCPFTQRIVVSLMRSNKMAEHIQLVTDTMRQHRDAMFEAISVELPEARVHRPEGGYFMWVALPETVSGDAVAERAIAHGVEVASGRVCFPEEDPGNFLRLSYSYPSPGLIREGIRRLGRAYRDVVGSN